MPSPHLALKDLGASLFAPRSRPGREAASTGAAARPASYRAFGAFRLFLALLVVVSHSRDLGSPGAISALKPWGLGNIAVLGFFMLSGFIIAEALERFYAGRTGPFLANRFLRLFPPYLAALALSVAIHLALVGRGPVLTFDYDTLPANLFGPGNLASNLLLVFVWYGLDSLHIAPVYPFVRYVWAVSVEWLFYVLFAVAFAPALERVRRPVIVFAAALAAGYLYRYTRVSWFYPLTFAPYFVAGVCLYHAVQWRDRAALVGAVVALALCYHHYYGYADRTREALMGGVLVVAIAPALAGLARLQLGAGWRRIDRFLGDLSYPVYLNHYVVTIALLNLTTERSVRMIALSLALSTLASLALALMVEPLTRQVRNRFRGTAIS